MGASGGRLQGNPTLVQFIARCQGKRRFLPGLDLLQNPGNGLKFLLSFDYCPILNFVCYERATHYTLRGSNPTY